MRKTRSARDLEWVGMGIAILGAPLLLLMEWPWASAMFGISGVVAIVLPNLSEKSAERVQNLYYQISHLGH